MVKTKKKKRENVPSSKWEFHGKRSAFPQTEDELSAYSMDLRKSGYIVSTEVVHFGASKIAQIFNIPITEFKASYR